MNFCAIHRSFFPKYKNTLPTNHFTKINKPFCVRTCTVNNPISLYSTNNHFFTQIFIMSFSSTYITILAIRKSITIKPAQLGLGIDVVCSNLQKSWIKQNRQILKTATLYIDSYGMCEASILERFWKIRMVQKLVKSFIQDRIVEIKAVLFVSFPRRWSTFHFPVFDPEDARQGNFSKVSNKPRIFLAKLATL